MADLRGQQLGLYTLTQKLGRGGMSEVYRATPADGSAEVAIKVLRLDPSDDEMPIFLERFHREASIISDLDHPHIVKIHDFDQEGDYIYYAMSLIGGGTLVDVIRAGVSQPEAVCHWLTQIASALDHAHKLDVIHRDLKPGNVLLDEDGNAYLTDFGIALLTNHTSNLTQTGIVIGTPAYMSPEQWRDEKLDGRSDVYGLAVMAYLLLALHTPFEAEAAHSMMYLHLNETPPPLAKYRPDLPEMINRVLMKALAKNPEQRYPSAGAFAADFLRAVQGESTEAGNWDIFAANPNRPKPIPEPAIPTVELPPPAYVNRPTASYDHLRPSRSAPWRRLWLLGVVGLVLVLTLVSAGFLLTSRAGDSASSDPTPKPPTATATLLVTPPRSSADIPRLRILTPTSGTLFEVNEPIVIEVEAFDSQGLTRVEVRRFGEVLDREILSGVTEPVKRVQVTLTYTPPDKGQYQLEILAYRGDLASDPEILRVEVR